MKTLAFLSVGALLVLVLVALPAFVRGQKEPAALKAIANNLRVLEEAKRSWALEKDATNGTPRSAVYMPPNLRYLDLPMPVTGEIYTITPVGTLNTADLTRKIAGREAGEVLTVTNF